MVLEATNTTGVNGQTWEIDGNSIKHLESSRMSENERSKGVVLFAFHFWFFLDHQVYERWAATGDLANLAE